MLKIAIIGDRGIPARYSGFSTLVEELALGLVHGHGMTATVYCRNHFYEDHSPDYRGVERVFLPAPGGKSFESIVHSNLAIAHAAARGYDVAFVVDPGNGPFLTPLRLRGTPTVLHTDGLGWQRRKWSPLQRKYYKWAEKASVSMADWLVTDSRAMQAYYRSEYRAPSTFIPYSGDVGEAPTDGGLARYGLERGGYYLVVARMEPENNVDLIIREYRAAKTTRPLVVVGGSPYPTDYAQAIAAESDEKVRCVGGVFESEILNGLYRDCYAYLHGHEVGGTNPSLLRAMHAGAPCIPIDVSFHREVVGEAGLYFEKSPGHLAEILSRVDLEPEAMAWRGAQARRRERSLYRWDAVVDAYAKLFQTLAQRPGGRRPSAEQLAEEFYRPDAFAETTAPNPVGALDAAP